MISASIEPDGIRVAVTCDVEANAAAGDFERVLVKTTKGNCLTADVESTSAPGFLDANGDFCAGKFPMKLAGCHEFRQGPEVQASENVALPPSPAPASALSPSLEGGRRRDAASMASTETSEGGVNNSR